MDSPATPLSHASLQFLPADALAHVCSHLHRSDRERLAGTCRTLRTALASGNTTLWQDVHRLKFGVSSSPSRAARELRLYEAASDMLCYTGAWSMLLRDETHSPLVGAAADGHDMYAAAGNRLVRYDVSGRVLAATELPRRAAALCTSSRRVAVAWDRAISIYEPVDGGGLGTTRPLRGHAKTVRSVAFVGSSDTCDDVVASGADDGAIRLHGARARRGVAMLRGHAGAVVQLVSSGGRALLSRAGERVKLWDVVAQRCVRTMAGGLFVADGKDMHTVYALSPGGGKSVRVHDSRTPGVAAVLSLPRHWSENRIGALAVRRGALVAAVGSGGIAHWPAAGPWEAASRGCPGRWEYSGHIQLKAITFRGDVAVAGGAGKELLASDLAASGNVVSTYCGSDGGSITGLLPVGGHRLVMTRKRDALLFDRSKHGARVDIELARRAVGDDEDECGLGFFQIRKMEGDGFFWPDSSEDDSSDDSSSYR